MVLETVTGSVNGWRKGHSMPVCVMLALSFRLELSLHPLPHSLANTRYRCVQQANGVKEPAGASSSLRSSFRCASLFPTAETFHFISLRSVACSVPPPAPPARSHPRETSQATAPADLTSDFDETVDVSGLTEMVKQADE